MSSFFYLWAAKYNLHDVDNINLKNRSTSEKPIVVVQSIPFLPNNFCAKRRKTGNQRKGRHEKI
jgi:hypothetical protein